MECPTVEQRLSEYVERSLAAEDMQRMAEHFHRCNACASLLEEMRSILATCQSFPVLQPDKALIEKILLRTSGRPRTRTLAELISQYVLRPMFTPRFAVGAVLATLFLVLVVNFIVPRASSVASALAPSELFRRMDRGVQGIYGEGLKLYDKKNEWQAQFTFFRNNLFNRLGIMIERLDVPMEGKKKPGEPQKQQEKAPGNESSLLLIPN
jgi:hypothetical protein